MNVAVNSDADTALIRKMLSGVELSPIVAILDDPEHISHHMSEKDQRSLANRVRYSLMVMQHDMARAAK